MEVFGTEYLGNNRCAFSVWAPEKKSMILHIVHPQEQKIGMQKDDEGYFHITLDNISPGAQYFFMPDGAKDIPDPASHHQPDGVHGASAVVDHQSFQWDDALWRGRPFHELILYEIHVGTFTPAGTFEAIIPLLDDLIDTGINAITLMPVSSFAGSRNWGYDGVYPYAAQHSYGGPEGLKKLVNACHQKGISVFLDVVYNHMGPEGNYLAEYGPYFTDTYCTPWGDAINFDGNWSDGVRDYFANNALFWYSVYHLDGLRIDAIHMVFDYGAIHFWWLLHDKLKKYTERAGRPFYTVAESDFNSPRVVQPAGIGGYGFDAQWLDDFHHALYVLLDKKGKERYEDFGRIEQLAKAYKEGFVLSGEYVKFRKRKYGASSAGVPGNKFVVFSMNHDQVGNRVRGERFSVLMNFDRLKLAAAAILLAPYVPMLFMGEEYAEETPFFYFISHTDPKLVEAVREGRKKEFAAFKSDGEPPDAYDEKTFADSKLNWQKRHHGKHGVMLQWYKTLISLRSHPVLNNFSKNDVGAYILQPLGLVLHRQAEGGLQHMLCLFNFDEDPLFYTMPDHTLLWHKILDSKERQWNETEGHASTAPDKIRAGDGLHLNPLSVVVYGMP